jgi:hypothetical protein
MHINVASAGHCTPGVGISCEMYTQYLMGFLNGKLVCMCFDPRVSVKTLIFVYNKIIVFQGRNDEDIFFHGDLLYCNPPSRIVDIGDIVEASVSMFVCMYIHMSVLLSVHLYI